MKTSTQPTHFDCPLCKRTIKVTKRGKVARHGHNRFPGAEMGHCPTSSWMHTSALGRALTVFTNHRAWVAAGSDRKPGREMSARDLKVVLGYADQDIARVKELISKAA